MVQFNSSAMSNSYEPVPEGINILRVDDIKPIMQQGKLKKISARFKDAKGRTLFNDYDVSKEGAMKALYSLLTTGCGLRPDSDNVIDESAAVGKYFRADVKHNVSGDRVFANLGYIKGSANGFEETKAFEPTEEVQAADDEYYDDPYL